MKQIFKISTLLIALSAIMFNSCTSDDPKPEPKITITGVSPTEVKTGSLITITGKNLKTATTVTLGNIFVDKTQLTFESDETMRFNVPPNVSFPCSLALHSSKQDVTWDRELTAKTTNPADDAKYSFEPKTASIQSFNFTSTDQIQCRNMGDYYHVGNYIANVFISNSQGYLNLNLVMPAGNPSFVPNGTYPIVPIITDGDITPFKAWASNGNSSSNEPNPSYVAKAVSGGYRIYYLVNGTVTIPNAATLNIDATSYFDSSISVKYLGTLQFR
jgi:hypothetical protein